MPKTVVLADNVRLRVAVSVRWDAAENRWAVRWLDQRSHGHAVKSTAVAAARSICKQLLALGVLSELSIFTTRGTIQDKRTYGDDPRRTRG